MWALLAAALSVGTTTRAVTFEEAMTLSEAHPAIAGIREAMERRAEFDVTISALGANPVIQLNPGYRSSPEEDRGFETIVALSQGFFLDDVAGWRRKAAARERAALAAEAQAALLDRRLNAARLWLALRAAETGMEGFARERALARALRAQVEQAEAMGAALAGDLAEARLAVGEADRMFLEAEETTLRLSSLLGRTIGVPPTMRVRTAGEAPAPELPDEATWPALLEGGVDSSKARERRLTASAARAREAALEALAGPELTAGLQWQLESPPSQLVFGLFGISIPVFENNARDRALELAAARRAEREAVAEEIEAGHRLALALGAIRQARRRLAVYRNELIPASAELVKVRVRTERLGEITAMELYEARRRRLEIERGAAKARFDVAWAEVRAWILLGGGRG